MKLLLDTHTFLWFVGGHPRLPHKVRGLIESAENQRFLSIASLWEMAIKVSLGKLEIAMPFPELISVQITDNDIVILPIAATHLDFLSSMPFHHRDPFDRLIVAQSQVEDLRILSRDKAFDDYTSQRIWD